MSNRDFPGDFILYSAIAGAVAAPIKSLVHHIFMWTGLAKEFYVMLTAFLVHGHHEVSGFWNRLFGELGDVAIGALFAIILALWLKYSHPRLHLWIGLGYGFGLWFASLAFGNLTKLIEDDMTDPWSLFAHLLAMLTFGALIVLASRYWRPLKERILSD